MVTAFVMIQAQTDSIPECAQKLSELEGISEVYSVAGDWDLIAIVRIKRYEDLAEVISNRVNKVEGVVETTTHLAFRAFSQHDLDAAFSLGLE
ncbi:Lrp/AsnC family transcriptional regulator [Zhihengliuella halotolerans]|uniref:AsnC family transcriptional regulator n=1 Tax=Zhihengliuella halotolerans TaxID=370736 RepID=A0A4V2G9S0_9MICC|nr:Lrp/AsnC ligand binding domain-containing protein [Zhihengliuella halotolerans]RZU61386.1 AsnC family transcriptional regulator [Zhihengliuella halotolerans]